MLHTVIEFPAETLCGLVKIKLEQSNRCAGLFLRGARDAKTLFVYPSNVVVPEENYLLKSSNPVFGNLDGSLRSVSSFANSGISIT